MHVFEYYLLVKEDTVDSFSGLIACSSRRRFQSGVSFGNALWKRERGNAADVHDALIGGMQGVRSAHRGNALAHACL
jgi:hypothetical protein